MTKYMILSLPYIVPSTVINKRISGENSIFVVKFVFNFSPLFVLWLFYQFLFTCVFTFYVALSTFEFWSSSCIFWRYSFFSLSSLTIWACPFLRLNGRSGLNPSWNYLLVFYLEYWRYELMFLFSNLTSWTSVSLGFQAFDLVSSDFNDFVSSFAMPTYSSLTWRYHLLFIFRNATISICFLLASPLLTCFLLSSQLPTLFLLFWRYWFVLTPFFLIWDVHNFLLSFSPCYFQYLAVSGAGCVGLAPWCHLCHFTRTSVLGIVFCCLSHHVQLICQRCIRLLCAHWYRGRYIAR